jgi:hypothetical protein
VIAHPARDWGGVVAAVGQEDLRASKVNGPNAASCREEWAERSQDGLNGGWVCADNLDFRPIETDDRRAL